MTKDEALKLALEALDCICSPLHVREITKVGNAMKAIREALAQPEQESDDLTIAYMSGFHDGKNTPQPKPEQKPVANGIIRTLVSIDKDGIETWKHEPFYTSPPKREWVGLTGSEVVEAYRSVSEKEWAIGGLDDARVFFRAIEDKLREKNT